MNTNFILRHFLFALQNIYKSTIQCLVLMRRNSASLLTLNWASRDLITQVLAAGFIILVFPMDSHNIPP